MTAEVISSCAVMCGLFLVDYGTAQLCRQSEGEGEFMNEVWECRKLVKGRKGSH